MMKKNATIIHYDLTLFPGGIFLWRVRVLVVDHIQKAKVKRLGEHRRLLKQQDSHS